MAELATIARPYAEALFRSSADAGLVAQVAALASVASDPGLRQFADNPKVAVEQVEGVLVGVLAGQGVALSSAAQNLLRTVLDNGRLAALPEIAAQYHALVSAQSGVSDAIVQSAFEISPALLPEVVATLEKRFGRKLKPTVVIDPSLIGGIRVVVGDEVLDTSVKARLEQMKVALAA